MKLKYLVILLLLSFSIISCKKATEEVPDKLEMPASISGHQIVTHIAYTLSYNEFHEQADWVAYELTKAEVLGDEAERTDDFRPDTDVETGSAELADYSGSGYDRGHLAPAADMQWSYDVMSESFLLSNMSPQTAGLNRGRWKVLESQVRDWAIQYGKVYVAVGGVLEDDLPVIGENKVSVPNYFYKAILDYENKKGIAFIMENTTLSGDISDYAVSIDEAEQRSGLDFFTFVPEDEQNRIENSFELTDWNFTHK